MATKLKIDLSQGILEVEGTETFVKAIYSDFKAHFVGNEVGEELPKATDRRRRPKAVKSELEAAAITPPSEPQMAAPVEVQPEVESVQVEPHPEPELPAPAEQKTKSPVARPDYIFLVELDLTPPPGRPSLVEFMDAKFPITNEERNLVFLHYLQHTLSLKDISINHIYTCYKAAKIRAPLNIANSLQTTADQQHWIKINKQGHLSLTQAGKLYVEKNLPKKSKG